MDAIQTYDIVLFMAVVLFVMGMAVSITGILILVFRAAGKDLQTLAAQTTKLAQKGIAEEIAGLVGNASALLETINQIIHTTAGIGLFLTVLGVAVMAGACWLALNVI